jgi:hypothetical protein
MCQQYIVIAPARLLRFSLCFQDCTLPFSGSRYTHTTFVEVLGGPQYTLIGRGIYDVEFTAIPGPVYRMRVGCYQTASSSSRPSYLTHTFNVTIITAHRSISPPPPFPLPPPPPPLPPPSPPFPPFECELTPIYRDTPMVGINEVMYSGHSIPSTFCFAATTAVNLTAHMVRKPKLKAEDKDKIRFKPLSHTIPSRIPY